MRRSIAPELSRRKEALEAFPLDQHGDGRQPHTQWPAGGAGHADKLLYQVRVGNYLGQNFGQHYPNQRNRIGLA